ncbi:hypothetical protein BBAD15_g7012 [Beauveria bassiana D1-5]|uniref:Uncharacterized protein n=1 Tax=Beauveria bassiana D1-5 TaxID=1245745 RepID=A0A0A2VIM0_BEABA|nr:hypothetical protein BBAD15_g7012 [Beauveria bassiana D1-5]
MSCPRSRRPSPSPHRSRLRATKWCLGTDRAARQVQAAAAATAAAATTSAAARRKVEQQDLAGHDLGGKQNDDAFG